MNDTTRNSSPSSDGELDRNETEISDELKFPKHNPNDPNLAHLSPSQKDKVRRDNIMNWVRDITKTGGLDVTYKGADYW